MSTPSRTIAVQILGKEFSVGCPPGQEDALLASAAYLNERMQAIKRRSKSALPLEKIAVMAALNVTRELLEARGVEGVVPGVSEEVLERLHHLKADIDSALAQTD